MKDDETLGLFITRLGREQSIEIRAMVHSSEFALRRFSQIIGLRRPSPVQRGKGLRVKVRAMVRVRRVRLLRPMGPLLQPSTLATGSNR